MTVPSGGPVCVCVCACVCACVCVCVVARARVQCDRDTHKQPKYLPSAAMGAAAACQPPTRIPTQIIISTWITHAAVSETIPTRSIIPTGA